MNPERCYPRADGKSYVVDLKAAESRQPNEPAYRDFAHTDRLDNFTAMEVTVKSRCHGHHLEGRPTRSPPSGCTTC